MMFDGTVELGYCEAPSAASGLLLLAAEECKPSFFRSVGSERREEEEEQRRGETVRHITARAADRGGVGATATFCPPVARYR